MTEKLTEQFRKHLNEFDWKFWKKKSNNQTILPPLPDINDKSHKAIEILWLHLEKAPEGSKEQDKLAEWIGQIVFHG